MKRARRAVTEAISEFSVALPKRNFLHFRLSHKVQTHAVLIRYADPADARVINAMGRADGAFRVSESIPFYEESELIEWASNRHENILAVVEQKEEVTGFLFCKVISHHWAMLDNFYRAPGARNTETAQKLRDWLLGELRTRKLSYLTCLIREDHESLLRLVRQLGFTRRSKYTWCELFI